MLVLEGRAPSALSVQYCRVLTVTRYSKFLFLHECSQNAALRASIAAVRGKLIRFSLTLYPCV